MTIYIDADACPVVGLTERVARGIRPAGGAFVRHQPRDEL